MRYRLWAVLLVTGCAFEGAGGDGAGDGDGPLPGQSMVLDTDFSSGELVSTWVTTPGVLEPAAYAVDGLRVRSYQSERIRDEDVIVETSSFESIELDVTAEQQGTAYYRPLGRQGDGNGSPEHLGTTQDDFILLFDGELHVTGSGQHELSIDSDDTALVELAPATGSLLREYMVVTDVPVVLPFALATEDEWIPIRVALEEESSWYDVAVRLDGQPVPAAQLRVRVNDHQGVHVRARREDYGAAGEAAVATIDDQFSGAPPLFPDAQSDRFRLRYVGQILIEREGAYELEAVVDNVADDSARVRIDGELVARTWQGVTDPISSHALDVGWHDLVVDLVDATSGAAIDLRIREAGTATFTTVPTDQLRPVAATGLEQRVLDTTNNFSTTAGSVTIAIDPMLPAGSVIEWQDHYLSLSGQTAATTVRVTDCGEYDFPLTDQQDELLEGSDSCRGMAPEVTTYLVTTDTSATVSRPGVASTYHGGPTRPPYAPDAVFVSTILDTADATALVSVDVAAQLRGGRVEAAVRSAATDDALASTAWTDVLEDGTIPAGTTSGPRTQYRLTLVTGGWSRVTVDSVKLTYAKP